ncbi:cystatin isoform X1 [Gallus gallus]|uniref:cystatin isoform X1 n=1 Tax=Gallus gallus TaxID=9031 RepID=UPI001F0305AB|nr:cystatin isoform X1 [Gallus gallus]
MAAAACSAVCGAMAGARGCVVLLAAALMLVGAVLGSEDRSRLLGAPVPVDENDEGLQRALQFAMAEYNRASNDKYSSRVVRVISAKRQVGAGPAAGDGLLLTACLCVCGALQEWGFLRLIQAVLLQKLVSGIKYILQVEIGRTTCPKSSGDLQSCEFHDEPEMAKYTTCTFVVYSIPWLNQIKLLESKCQ